MTEEQIAELLKLTLLSKYDDDINDQIVDEFLATDRPDASNDVVSRIKKRFVEKRVAQEILHPVKEVKPEFTFGDFVGTTRNSLKLSLQDVAFALGESSDIVDGLERGSILPWKCSPELIGGLMRLFQLHYNAAASLVSKTALTSQASGPVFASARSAQGKMTEARGESTAKALSRFLAMNTKAEEPTEEVTNWLSELKNTLASHDWKDLVDS